MDPERAEGWFADASFSFMPGVFGGVATLFALICAGVGHAHPRPVPPELAAERLSAEERLAAEVGFARAPAAELVAAGEDRLHHVRSLRADECLAALVAVSGSRYPDSLEVTERGHPNRALATSSGHTVVQHVQMCAPRAMRVEIAVRLEPASWTERERSFEAQLSLWTAEREICEGRSAAGGCSVASSDELRWKSPHAPRASARWRR